MTLETCLDVLRDCQQQTQAFGAGGWTPEHTVLLALGFLALFLWLVSTDWFRKLKP